MKGKHPPRSRGVREVSEVAHLERLIEAGAPSRTGTNEDATGFANARVFEDLPLSQYTKEGLTASNYVTLTAIQRVSLPHALAGRDILGAAKTGSGKTLSFLIPVIEKLYRLKWTRRDGLGGLILTPTRELAIQIFDELRKVGQHHELSAGLLIGGKDVKEEQQVLATMNILVSTPGRLLQHMDETAGFDSSGLQVLVLDEADRILDLGFAATLDAILANLPKKRQTLLFSATQTKSVKALARLSLVDPQYLAVHEQAEAPTPLRLDQAYTVVQLQEKMDVIWSFTKSHLDCKTIVFLSTCKQVRFVHEAFRRLRPGLPVRALHGGMKQPKRMCVFYEFCEAKSMLLFATDIAARGLDFPTVDWVLQVDCPEDAAAYIHRVGRTARYMSAGRALLLLTPSEQPGMLDALGAAKIPIKHIKVNPTRAQPVGPALQALLSKNTELKEYAQRALVAYVRSVFLQPNKAIFDVKKIPVQEYASSLGLFTAPKLRFLKKVGTETQTIEIGGSGIGLEEEEEGDVGPSQPRSSKDQAEPRSHPGMARKAAKGAAASSKAPSSSKASRAIADEDGDDDLMTIKKRDVFAEEPEGLAPSTSAGTGIPGTSSSRPVSKPRRLKIKDGKASGSRVVFDEDGNNVNPLELLALTELGTSVDAADSSREGVHVVKERASERFQAAADILRRRDREDKASVRDLRQETKRQLKASRRKALMDSEPPSLA